MTEEEIAQIVEMATEPKVVKSDAGQIEQRKADEIIALLDYAASKKHKGRQIDRYGFYRTVHIDRD